MANMGRYFRSAIATAFEACGGQLRYNDWADKNYGDFVKTQLVRLVPKEVEVQASVDLTTYLRQLDAMTIEGEAKELVDD